MKDLNARKVLLVHPPPSGGDLFPVSVGYVAASLKSRGFHVKVADMTAGKYSAARLARDLKGFRPRVVGFSVYQANIFDVLKMAALVKKLDKNSSVVLGGPQVTFMPEKALLEMPEADVLCRGEGETVMPLLCERLVSGLDLAAVKGIVFRKNGAAADTGPGELERDLDRFPSPYQSGVFEFTDHKKAVLLTSRGCSCSCDFCYTPAAFRRTVRFHSVRRVIADIRVCLENNISSFYFADPSFTQDKERVKEIMRRIIKNSWKLTFWCETRADQVDRATLTLMAKAGAKTIAYGLETSDPGVMKRIGKKINLDDFRKTVAMTREFGIEPEVFTLYGLPGQTYASACRTLDFVKSLGVKISGNSGGQRVLLYFGTKFYVRPRDFGITVSVKKRPSFLSPGPEYTTGQMTALEIAAIEKRYGLESGLELLVLARRRKRRA